MKRHRGYLDARSIRARWTRWRAWMAAARFEEALLVPLCVLVGSVLRALRRAAGAGAPGAPHRHDCRALAAGVGVNLVDHAWERLQAPPPDPKNPVPEQLRPLDGRDAALGGAGAIVLAAALRARARSALRRRGARVRRARGRPWARARNRRPSGSMSWGGAWASSPRSSRWVRWPRPPASPRRPAPGRRERFSRDIPAGLVALDPAFGAALHEGRRRERASAERRWRCRCSPPAAVAARRSRRRIRALRLRRGAAHASRRGRRRGACRRRPARTTAGAWRKVATGCADHGARRSSSVALRIATSDVTFAVTLRRIR